MFPFSGPEDGNIDAIGVTFSGKGWRAVGDTTKDFIMTMFSNESIMRPTLQNVKNVIQNVILPGIDAMEKSAPQLKNTDQGSEGGIPSPTGENAVSALKKKNGASAIKSKSLEQSLSPSPGQATNEITDVLKKAGFDK